MYEKYPYIWWAKCFPHAQTMCTHVWLVNLSASHTLYCKRENSFMQNILFYPHKLLSTPSVLTICLLMYTVFLWKTNLMPKILCQSLFMSYEWMKYGRNLNEILLWYDPYFFFFWRLTLCFFIVLWEKDLSQIISLVCVEFTHHICLNCDHAVHLSL